MPGGYVSPEEPDRRHVGLELLYEPPREVWESDINAALNDYVVVPTEGAGRSGGVSGERPERPAVVTGLVTTDFAALTHQFASAGS